MLTLLGVGSAALAYPGKATRTSPKGLIKYAITTQRQKKRTTATIITTATLTANMKSARQTKVSEFQQHNRKDTAVFVQPKLSCQ